MLNFYNMEKNLKNILRYFMGKLDKLLNGTCKIITLIQVKSKIALTF